MTDRDKDPEPDSSEQENRREEPGELAPEVVNRRFNELMKALEDSDPDLGKRFEAEPEAAAPPPEEEPTLLELWDRDLPDDDEEEDDYVPPDPPPVPWPSLPAVGGVLLVIGGLVLLVNPGIAPLGTNPGRLVGFVAFLSGVWLLISRLRPDKDEDDTDDGAVV